MAELAYRDALNQALAEEMARDPRVFLMGEEVARYDGAYKVSKGLLDKFGSARVVDAPISELGFVRVSMSPAYRADFADAQVALAEIINMRQARLIPDTLSANKLPILGSYADATDAYLVELAKTHALQLATLDGALCQKPWAMGVAENPL